MVDQDQLGRILRRVWDPEEFLSPAGIRSLSKIHETHQFIYGEDDVRYEPAEANKQAQRGPLKLAWSSLVSHLLFAHFGLENVR